MIKIQPKLNNYLPQNISFKSKSSEEKSEKKGITSTYTAKISANKYGTLVPFLANNFFKKRNKKQVIEPKYFLIKMQGYGKDYTWAQNMIRIALGVSKQVKNKEDFKNILTYVCEKVQEINTSYYYGKLKGHFNTSITIGRSRARGVEYMDKYVEKLKDMPDCEFIAKGNDKYKKPNTSTIRLVSDNYAEITYGYNPDGETNLDLCEEAYRELITKDNPTEKEILEACAVIQWLISQECPFWKGNDSIANLLTKGIMHCYGLEISQIKEGHSLDFEAFYRDLDDYIEKYPTFFEKYPKKKFA